MGRLNPARLKAIREAKGWSQTELARRAASTQPSINRLESGGTDHPRNLLQLARALGTTPEYLTDETDDHSSSAGVNDPRAGFASFPPEADPDIVELPQVDLRYGMGGTYLDAPISEERQPFSRAWLRTISPDPPESLFWAVGDGDSMEPTIRSGEMLLINRSERTPRVTDGIWALAWGEVGMVKRLRLRPDGGVEILSDNPMVPPMHAAGDEIHLIGRVVAVVRRL